MLQKFDPYLNVDPGTMNPFQHGEVYVLNDGAETDLDFGHYERFTNSVLTRHNSLTSGQVYETVIAKERRGDYLGKTVQVIPHVTNEIKDRIRLVEREQPADVLITEIGGTTGDIEGLPFLEAIRQFICWRSARATRIVMHVTLIPFIKAAGELKTKPSQQSVAKLREIGLQPQVLICRTEHELDTGNPREALDVLQHPGQRRGRDARREEHDLRSAAHAPERASGRDRLQPARPGKTPAADMTDWKRFVGRVIYPKKTVKIALVGKYIEHQDAYKSIYESLIHAAASYDCGMKLISIDAQTLEAGGDDRGRRAARLSPASSCPAVSANAASRGRSRRRVTHGTHKIPYLGLCLGMQVATIEFARNACGLEDANSTEFDLKTPHPVISLLEEQRKVVDKGASMRLGVWPTKLDSRHARRTGIWPPGDSGASSAPV